MRIRKLNWVFAVVALLMGGMSMSSMKEDMKDMMGNMEMGARAEMMVSMINPAPSMKMEGMGDTVVVMDREM